MEVETQRTVERTSWKELALVVVLALAAQARMLGNELVYDDRVLVENPALRAPWSFPGTWGETWWGVAKPGTGLYRPLASWTLSVQGWMNERLGFAFESVGAFHAANALVHAAASALVLLYLRALGLGRGAAVIAASLFAVLALHVEALAPVTGRSETLALGFGLAFALLHTRRSSPWAAAACFLAALACKESAAGFLVLAGLHDVVVRRERPAWGRLALAGGALVAYLGARAWVLRGEHGAVFFVDNPLVAASAWERVLTACVVQLDYLRLACVPIGFRSDASHAELELARGLGDGRVLLFLGVLGGLVAWAVRAWPRQRAVALSLVGYAVLFAPASNVLFVIGTPRAERLAYAPSLFVCALFGVSIAALGAQGARLLARSGSAADARGPERRARGIASVAAGLLVVWNLAASWQRSAVWRDPATFFRAQVAEAPRSAKARFNLGAQLAAEGDDPSAEREYGEALRLWPDHHEALYNLGNLLRRRKEPERALELYRRALELQPQFLPPAFGIVGALHELGRDDEARAMLAQVERRAPSHPWLPAHRKLLERGR
ncbi:MAG: tetratricopeptide repeat protein [Planctomycetes bacterium]|nr:tetratricopeptide repeat protein [Planctomycetota bacterium]